MSWCRENRPRDYHWIKDLYQRLGLPVVPAIVDALSKASEECARTLAKKKSDEGKQKRIQQKVARAEDQEERKKWVKCQAVQHTYGAGEDDDGNLDGDDPNLVSEAQALLEGISNDPVNVTVVSGRKCRCGSLQHQRTSHRDCPLNKKAQQTAANS